MAMSTIARVYCIWYLTITTNYSSSFCSPLINKNPSKFALIDKKNLCKIPKIFRNHINPLFPPFFSNPPQKKDSPQKPARGAFGFHPPSPRNRRTPNRRRQVERRRPCKRRGDVGRVFWAKIAGSVFEMEDFCWNRGDLFNIGSMGLVDLPTWKPWKSTKRLDFCWNTPQTFDIAPENKQTPKRKACLPTIIFHGAMLDFMGVGGICFKIFHGTKNLLLTFYRQVG